MKVQLIIVLLQCLSTTGLECPIRPGCSRTRLYICCYFAQLNRIPRGVTNLTQYLSVTKDNITILTHDAFVQNDLLNLQSLSLVQTRTRNIEAGAFRGIDQLRKITISSNELETIQPHTFQGLPFLSHLDLSTNRIKELTPRAFYGLKLLRKLDLSRNQLNSLSEEMFEGMKTDNLTVSQKLAASIRNQRELIFGITNIITTKPHSFQHLSQFHKLTLGGNPKQRIAFIERNTFLEMIHLQILYLQYISFISHEAFVGLISLTTLNLSRISLVDSKCFQGLIHLEELDISRYNLRLSNGSFKNLANLSYLRLDLLGIRHIYKGAFSGLNKLQILKITRQEITALQYDVFHEIVNLAELDLEGNKIIKISARTFSRFQKLKVLNLRGNQIGKIEGGTWNYMFTSITTITDIQIGINPGIIEPYLLKYLPSLKSLSFKGNITKEITDSAKNMKLHNLKIENCLTKLDIDYFKHFNELRDLQIEYSTIQFIKLGEFCSFPKLKKLVLISGQLNTTKPGTFIGLNQLQELNLMRNKLNDIQEGVFGTVNHMSAVSILYDINNTISKSCETNEGLLSLQILILSHNNISYIHQNAFKGNVNLKHLNLSFNRIKALLYTVEIRTSIFEETSVLNSLHQLKDLNLYRNKLTTISANVFNNNHNLENLSIALNPLTCDCNLKELWLWMEKSRIKFDYPPWCNSRPGDWRDKVASLKCEVKEIPSSSLKISTDEDIMILQLYVAPAILSAIIFIGAFGNLLLILIFILNSDMRTGPNVYIINLTVADTLNLVVNLPLSFIDNSSRSWGLGSVTCQIFIFMRDFSVGLSVYSVVALSIQRYVVIVHPLKFREGKFGVTEGCGACIHIVVVWIIAVTFALPSFMLATLEGDRCLNAATHFGKEYMHTIWTAQLLIYCVLPVILIMILYIRTAFFLRQSTRRIPGNVQYSELIRRRAKLAHMVVTLTIVFCISYAPNFLVRVLVAWSLMDQHSSCTLYVSFVSYCLFFSNTCFNPIALYLMSSKFRALFRAYILFWQNKNIFKNTKAKKVTILEIS